MFWTLGEQDISAQYLYVEHALSATQSVPVANSPVRLSGDQESYTIAGLQSGSNYRIRVMGENNIGQGPMSNLLQAFTADTIPDAPIHVAEDASVLTDHSQIALTWSEGAWNGGQEVTGYRITYGGLTVDVDEPRVTLSGLTANTAYTVGIQAINSVGYS